MRNRSSRPLAAVAACLGLFAFGPATANATFPKAFNNTLTCSVPEATGVNAGLRVCSGIVPTWDGVTPIDVNLILPPNPSPAADGPYALMGEYHGWGSSKGGISAGVPNAAARRWTSRGYAYFSISDRGWGLSCGATDPKRPTPACLKGYNHLMDTRYEVRDAQYLIGLLVDDGIADPGRIGARGPSYGGGMSMAQAALRNRIMLPNGTYAPWRSPSGTPIELAGATPSIPWTDLAYSLQPNGATLDYVADAPYFGPNGDKRIGVLKQSFVAGLYGTGSATSNYAVPGTDPEADLTTWYTSINAGEPYDSDPLSNQISNEIISHHSNYYIDHSITPAPMLISNGWTDDLFPPDEAVRFYNRTRTEHPDSDIGLYFLDYGHQRGRNASGDTALLAAAENAWMDHFVLGTGAAPAEGVSTLPQVCNGANPSGTVVTAANWAAISPGEVRFTSAGLQAISPSGGNSASGQAFDPVAGGGACATASATDVPSVANYRLAAAPAGGFTLLGSPTIIADIYSPGANNQVAARLVDVDPVSGNETLVDRGLWRPIISNANGPTAGQRQVFQLHPNRWKFASGHIAKLELLPSDQPYGRNSNGQTPITVQNLELRIPTLEQPGAPGPGGLISAPAGKILPPGYTLASDFTPDADADNDGWPDGSDNCPQNANGNQLDSDGDGIGDVCDSVNNDTDGDGVQNSADNCPDVSNPSQVDTDSDNIGDACDSSNNDDIDGDGISNASDNCQSVSNPGQQDADADGIGDACDSSNSLDLDNDGVLDSTDNCPNTSNNSQTDTDDDGVGNACDPLNNNDFDDDGVLNASDNCQTVSNPGQSDADSDGAGDACDQTDNRPASPLACDNSTTQRGTNGDDTLLGTEAGDVLYGLQGGDKLVGNSGDDCLWGQRGNDSLVGGEGNDVLNASAGNDLLKGGKGQDMLVGGLKGDLIKARDGEVDTVRCGPGRDTVIADRRDAVRDCEVVKLPDASRKG